jgi:hypothetical protein
MSTPPGPPPPTPPPSGAPAPRFATPPAYVPLPPAHFKRPLAVSLLAVLNGISGGFLLIGALLMVVAGIASGSGDRSGAVAAGIIGVCIGLFAAFYLAAAVGLWTLKHYGRVCQMISSVFGLLAIPIGTIISGLILYYLTRPGVKLLFSGQTPADLSPDERLLVERDSNQSVVMVVMLIVALFGGVAMIGIIAAIAIPGLLRARMAGNEASAIGSVRAMSSAQAAWTASHNGAYGLPSCLGSPQSCGETAAQPYLPPDLASLGEKSGYTFGFVLRHPHIAAVTHADPRVHDPSAAGESGEAPASDVPSDAEVQRQLSEIPGALPPTPVEGAQEPQPGGFVYWASPVNPGVTGNRRFCINEASTVFEYDLTTAWVDPTADTPACPEGGRPVQ